MRIQIWRITLKILMVIMGGVAGLLILELGVRLLPLPYSTSDGDAHICSTEFGWLGKPDHDEWRTTDGYTVRVRHNQFGMHDTDHSQAKSSDTYRVLMLGDSFTWAAQVNEQETSSHILQDLLKQGLSPRPVEVINAGVTGWSTEQELLYYRQIGYSYQPDLVLLMFYVGNDVYGNLPGEARTLAGRNCYSPYFVVCNGQFDPVPLTYAPGVSSLQPDCSPYKHWFINFLGWLYQSSRLYAQIEPLFVKVRPLSINLPPYLLYNPKTSQPFDYAWQVTLATIRQLYREVNNNGSRLVVVLIAPAEVVKVALLRPSQLEEIFQKIPNLRQAHLDLPHQRLITELSKDGIEILDLQPEFIHYAVKQNAELYFPVDKHWNVEGNKLAAQLIFNYLQKGKTND
ncbi:MAG: SGNH/GDSL hydrolase family protein [Anaerolineae bacterium]